MNEGITGSDGIFSHPYFQTGTYNITAKNGEYRGSIRVEYSQENYLEVALTESMVEEDLSGTTTTLIVLGAVIIAGIFIALAYKRLKKH